MLRMVRGITRGYVSFVSSDRRYIWSSFATLSPRRYIASAPFLSIEQPVSPEKALATGRLWRKAAIRRNRMSLNLQFSSE